MASTHSMGGEEGIRAPPTDNAAIVATNDSSIVSKRSVEKLYVSNRADHLLRYFVPKFQRRSPLINRGYWLRMQLISRDVEDFLNASGSTRKHVVNLGCGFDPLPFHYTKDFPDVTFIDVDFPESVHRKCNIIRNTPELSSLLNGQTQAPMPNSVIFSAGNYIAAGIDLSDLSKLDELLGSLCDESDQLLFVSEVAITYMPVKNADALIKWTSKFPNGRFALIEQILPAGPNHPFASTMLSHFRKINSPLRNIGDYPTLLSQVQRFQSVGWKSVSACDLYGAWCNLIPENEKSFVDSVEAFDEHEDFVLFGQHYLYLHADMSESNGNLIDTSEWTCGDRYSSKYESQPELDTANPGEVATADVYFEHQDGNHGFGSGRRKFGAATELDAVSSLYYGGMDNKTRASSIYVFDDKNRKTVESDSINGPSPRVCHTLTKLREKKVLMVGGRSSPDAPCLDCWLYEDSTWRRVQDLPSGRYRHAAVHIASDTEDQVLIFGGRGANRFVHGEWLTWSEESGWREISSPSAVMPQARFSASMSWSSASKTGLLSGGFRQNGTIFSDLWSFSLMNGELNFVKRCLQPTYDNLLSRGGSQMVSIDDSKAILFGGVSGKRCFTHDYSKSFLLIDWSNNSLQTLSVNFNASDAENKRPILAGFSCVWRNSQLEILGGGIIAFSMGAFWNRGISVIRFQPISRTTTAVSGHESNGPARSSPISQTENGGFVECTEQIGRYRLNESQLDVREVMKQKVPLLLEGLSFGRCVDLWSPDYLKSAIGHLREVIVHKIDDAHVSSLDTDSPIHMNFNSKNFVYTRLPFPDFIDIAFSQKQGSPPCYLRSISNKPTKFASLLQRDFPEISSDFKLPTELAFIEPSLHSSILRISSAGVGVWLHYDVCANVLFHIKGRKRVLLFPPTDISKLQFPPEKTTSSIDNIFENIPSGTHPKEVVMHPGDALYLPPFWLHAVLPLEPCIAVNTFFHSFDEALYSGGKDLYGNKDLACYQEGRNALKDVLAKFDGLDESVRRFYVTRLGQELLERAAD